ncbi:ATP cone domain-containing protein [Desulfovibrio sp. G11]|uniref:ATP cone domain-containing protein n=1 Tax=Desulfovibrio sp. G11 TaxID=631220 RepID=UPI0022B76C45|nr:ATP cone domain-containing protein [Desulfovibrio sp. G11]
MPASIIKRDGTAVPFDSVKILNAITKANQAVGARICPPLTFYSSPKKFAKS